MRIPRDPKSPMLQALEKNKIEKVRQCLRCEVYFMSAGPWNRICLKCERDRKVDLK